MSAAPGEGAERTLWRVFPWNADAADGEPFSVCSVAPVEKQTGGRFDNDATSVLYLGELPEHTVAEVLARLPGFRWWSAIHGAWHSTVLFADRVPLDALSFGTPELLDITDPAVVAAARELRML